MAQQSQAHLAFGRAVREYRGRLGLSQDDLADRSGLNRNYIGDIERGTRNFGFRTLQRLAEGLGVQASELVAHAEELQAD